MQKTCSRCGATEPLSSFVKRAKSSDGLSAACRACLAAAKQQKYWVDPAERAAASLRAARVKQARFKRDPGYKRAFNLWNSTKRRTRYVPWIKITDFLPICRKAVRAGSDYVLDHIVPLKHPLVCGLHVPWNLRVVLRKTNDKKRSHFEPLGL